MNCLSYLVTVCVAAFLTTNGSAADLSEKDLAELCKTLPQYPPGQLICNELAAADIPQCVNFNADLANQKSGTSQEHYTDIDAPHAHRKRRVTAHWLAWPKNEDGYVYVPYYFATSNSNVTRAFLAAVEDFDRLTCIRLIPRISSHQSYIRLFSGSGCYTFLGKRGGSQDLSLQAYTACAQKGVAIHEILHVLGFYHEMSRRDRNEHITIHYDNIYTSRQRQFRMHEYGNGSVYGEEYDVQSIMHYGNYGFAIDRSRPTITSNRDPTEVLGQVNGMSEKDVRQVNKMYGCNGFINMV